MFLEGVSSVVPLLAMICVGFFFAPSKWFGKAGMSFMSSFCLNLAIPFYMFYNVVRAYSRPSELFELFFNLQYPFIIILSGMAIGAVMAAILHIRPPRRGVFINAISLSNTVIMGMPVVASLYGEQILPVTMIFYAANTTLYWTVGVWIIRRETGAKSGKGIFGTLKAVFGTPPMFGFLCGLAWVMLKLPIPMFATRTLGMISACVTPLAMMFIGSVIRFAEFRHIAHWRDMLIAVGYRCLAVPFVTAGICSLLPVAPVVKQVFFILSNMPAMAQLPIVAREVGSDYEYASMVTAITTTISMAMVPVYVFILNYTKFLG
jgi:Predicted permeases